MKKRIFLFALAISQLHGTVNNGREGFSAKIKRLATQIQSPNTKNAAANEILNTPNLRIEIEDKAREQPKGIRPPESAIHAQTILKFLQSMALQPDQPEYQQTSSSAAGGSSKSSELFKAVQRGDVDKVTALLQNPKVNLHHRAPVDQRSTCLRSGGNTPLHEALKKLREEGNQNYATIAKMFIDNKNINATLKNDAQATPLHVLAGFVPEKNPCFPEPLKTGEVQDNNEKNRPDLAEIADELIQIKKVDINAKDEAGKTPLHWASIQGFPELVEILISHSALIDAQDLSGCTPLMKAAQKGHLVIMQQLLNAGATVNLQDTDKGRTALHWTQRMREGATVKGENQMTKERALEAMKILLKAGANPTLKDNEGRSAIDWAIECSPWVGKQEETRLLLDPKYMDIQFKG